MLGAIVCEAAWWRKPPGRSHLRSAGRVSGAGRQRQEEARLESLRQPSSTHETRAARITGTFTMPDKTLREQDRRLEDKIRVNEARLELLEARLRRGEEDEKCQREKIATLKQQLAALAQGAAPQK